MITFEMRRCDCYLAEHLLGWRQDGSRWLLNGKPRDVPLFSAFPTDFWTHIEPAMLQLGYMLFIQKEPAREHLGRAAFFECGWAHQDLDALTEHTESHFAIYYALCKAACKAVGPERSFAEHDGADRPY